MDSSRTGAEEIAKPGCPWPVAEAILTRRPVHVEDVRVASPFLSFDLQLIVILAVHGTRRRL